MHRSAVAASGGDASAWPGGVARRNAVAPLTRAICLTSGSTCADPVVCFILSGSGARPTDGAS
jgi:hypothetical protein